MLSRHFSEIKAIWLAFDSLFYFTTEHLILKKKGEKSSKYPFEKILGSGVSYIKGEGVSTLYVRSTLREPLGFI